MNSKALTMIIVLTILAGLVGLDLGLGVFEIISLILLFNALGVVGWAVKEWKEDRS